MQLLIVMLIVAAVAVFVTVPLRREHVSARGDRAEEDVARQAVEELEAAREAKYREIRDAELDHGTGKLSDRDFASVDAALRGEAVQILKALDDARQRLQRIRAAAADAGDAAAAEGESRVARQLPSRSP